MTHEINRGSMRGGHPIADATYRAAKAKEQKAVPKVKVVEVKPKRKYTKRSKK